MELREPKRKRRVKVQLQSPFPISLNTTKEWTIYTAHLTDMGSCIVDPVEIAAVHSMGYFGKGSLSRSYPSFGRARYGAPPLIRHRQWIQRHKWLEEVKQLSEESITDSEKNNQEAQKECLNENKKAKGDNECNIENEEEILAVKEKQSISNVVDLTEKNKQDIQIIMEKSNDEIFLDSAEEDDMCVILGKNSQKLKSNKSIENNIQEESTNREELICSDNMLENKNSLTVNDIKNLQGKLLVLPDSDSDTENYLQEIKPRIESEGFPIRETLHLTFEETFFLLYGLGCLQVINYDGHLLDVNSAWIYFCKEDKYFLQKYVVYHYFRSKGWVVKPGLKYGGDFLLYKQGPPFYHASYIVIIDVLDADTLIRDTTKSMHKITWNNLFGLDRLSETTAKEILFAQVLWPFSVSRNVNPPSPDVLSEFTVKELLCRRWNPKQNRDVIQLDEEDEDSC